MPPISAIAISTDPRFILARKLITSGSPEDAIDIFANLLENCRTKLGEDSFDAALCQYEYGNALFRAVLQKQDTDAGEEDNEYEEDERKPRAKSDGERQRDVIAAAAEKRFGTEASLEPSKKRTKTEIDSKGVEQSNNTTEAEQQKQEDDDLELALEMIETALHILLARVASKPEGKDEPTITNAQREWALNQIPRFLICLGDFYAFREEHSNAVDAYIRALSYREEKWKELKENKKPIQIEQLQCRRLYIEACTLVAEALLACADGNDVVCESKDETVMYAKAAERIDFALSWFEVARRELDDLCK